MNFVEAKELHPIFINQAPSLISGIYHFRTHLLLNDHPSI